MSDFILHCIDRHGESARAEADEEYDLLMALAIAVLDHTRKVAGLHAKLRIARDFTRMDGRVIRLDYDRASAIQEAIDALELSAEASCEVAQMTAKLIDQGA